MRLVLAVHHHQPIGAPSAVLEADYVNNYAPLLQLLEDFPHVAVSLHTSGHLLEWLVDRHPEYLDRLRALIARGQVEPLCGSHYAAILPAIPRPDRLGQMRLHSALLSEILGVQPTGLWLPGGVWTPHLVSDLLAVGIESVVLDSRHLLAAGLGYGALDAVYLTEFEGQSLRVLPGVPLPVRNSPFADPQRFLDWLVERPGAALRSDRVLTLKVDCRSSMAGTPDLGLVSILPWLGGLFARLPVDERGLAAVTVSEGVSLSTPAGLLDLPAGGVEELNGLDPQIGEPADGSPGGAPQVRGATVDWKWSRLGGPPSRGMYVRGLEVSRRLADFEREFGDRELTEPARRDLYRAQADCGRWPGDRGGWELSCLRNEVYRNLIQAETRLERFTRSEGRWCDISVADFNLDARPEIKLTNDRLIAYVAPDQGGRLYEFDVRAISSNLLSSWGRPDWGAGAAEESVLPGRGESATPSPTGIPAGPIGRESARSSQTGTPGLARQGAADHLLLPGLSLERFLQGEGRLGALHATPYTAGVRRSSAEATVRLSGEWVIAEQAIQVHKRLSLRPGESRLRMQYRLANLPPQVTFHFGVLFQMAVASQPAGERFFYGDQGQRLGSYDSPLVLEDCSRLGLTDEVLGLDLAFDVSQAGGFWIFPVTAAQSLAPAQSHPSPPPRTELQAVGVMPHWEFEADADGRFEVSLDLICDTSAAQARRLLELSPPVRLPSHR